MCRYARRVPHDFSFGARVVVRVNGRTRQAGTAGRVGTVAGLSREPDVAMATVVGYAVAMEDDERVWMVEPEDLDPV